MFSRSNVRRLVAAVAVVAIRSVAATEMAGATNQRAAPNRVIARLEGAATALDAIGSRARRRAAESNRERK